MPIPIPNYSWYPFDEPTRPACCSNVFLASIWFSLKYCWDQFVLFILPFASVGLPPFFWKCVCLFPFALTKIVPKYFKPKSQFVRTYFFLPVIIWIYQILSSRLYTGREPLEVSYFDFLTAAESVHICQYRECVPYHTKEQNYHNLYFGRSTRYWHLIPGTGTLVPADRYQVPRTILHQPTSR